jgi:hypothetical protein
MSMLQEQLERNQAESQRLWKQADGSQHPHERYALAWGAMDCDLAVVLLQEALAAMNQERAA